MITCDGSQTAAGVQVYIDGQLASRWRFDVIRWSAVPTIQNHYEWAVEIPVWGTTVQSTKCEFCSDYSSEQHVADWFHADRIRGIVETDSKVRSGHDTEILQDYFISQHGDQSLKTARDHLKKAQQAGT